GAASLDEVLHPGKASVAPVPVIPLDRDDRLHDLKQLLRRREAQGRSEPGEGVGLAVRLPETATDRDVVPDDLPVLFYHYDGEVVGQDVRAVILREGEGDLELPREVVIEIERIRHRRVLGRDLLSLDPDVVIGA